MKNPHELAVIITTETPVPTEEGGHVVGAVEFVSECDPAGHASTRCRVVGEERWYPVRDGRADLADPAHLPFHHATTISRLLMPQPGRPGVTGPRPVERRTTTPDADERTAAFYFCDDLDSPPQHLQRTA